MRGGGSVSHNVVWREVHRSPTSNGDRIFECKHCSAMKTTKRRIPKVCEFCNAKCGMIQGVEVALHGL